MSDRDLSVFRSQSAHSAGTESGEMTDFTVTVGESEGHELLRAIADQDCQAILAACADEGLTVAQLVERCEIPTATAYRKVNLLVDVGVLSERVQIRPYGRNEHEYTLCIDTVHVDLTPSASRETSSSSSETDERVTGYPLTDGGQGKRDEDVSSSTVALRNMFVDITGTEEVVDEQEQNRSTRRLSEKAETLISEYVSASIQEDGLSDSLPDNDSHPQR